MRFRESGMIGIVAIIKVHDGKGPELEQVFRDQTPKVRANEPGCLAYQLTKSRKEPNLYKVLELYTDEDAVKHHGGTDYFKAAGALMAACMDGRADVERLDAVV
jgi:quinol monooxygenase YgiN